MHSAASLGALDGGADVSPRLVVASVPGLARGMSYDVARRRGARPRRRRDPARGPVRLLAARAPDAPGGDPRHRGPRLDERHLPQRRAAARAAAAAPRRPRPHRRLDVHATRTETSAAHAPRRHRPLLALRHRPRPARERGRLLRPLAGVRRGRRDGRRAGRRGRLAAGHRGVRAGPEPTAPASAARSCWPSASRRPTSASTRCRSESMGRAGMGTTITAAHVGEHDVAIAHVGDSRAYRLRGEEFTRLTEDHSLVEEMRRRGQLTAQEADEHPQRSIITRALGPEPDVVVDTRSWRGSRRRRLPAVQRRPDVDGARVRRWPTSCARRARCPTPAMR